jgi:hypothetical protein
MPILLGTPFIVMFKKSTRSSLSLIIREAKFKTSLRVDFFLDFRNFIFASSPARIK